MKTARLLSKMDRLETKSLDRNKKIEHRRKYVKLLRPTNVSEISESKYLCLIYFVLATFNNNY